MARGEPLRVQTLLIAADTKRLRVHHAIRDGAGDEIATAEYLYLHVNRASGPGRAAARRPPGRRGRGASRPRHPPRDSPVRPGRNFAIETTYGEISTISRLDPRRGTGLILVAGDDEVRSGAPVR
jgi:hypothetical protein